MTTRLEPDFPDCLDCVFWNARRRNPACRACPSGENFEARIREVEPTENDLYKMLKDWSDDDDAE